MTGTNWTTPTFTTKPVFITSTNISLIYKFHLGNAQSWSNRLITLQSLKNISNIILITFPLSTISFMITIEWMRVERLRQTLKMSSIDSRSLVWRLPSVLSYVNFTSSGNHRIIVLLEKKSLWLACLFMLRKLYAELYNFWSSLYRAIINSLIHFQRTLYLERVVISFIPPFFILFTHC